MHMIRKEAAGLKPEAVVSYFREKERGRKVSEPPKAFFPLKKGTLDGVENVPIERLEECKICLLRRSPLPPSLMFHPPRPCYMSAPPHTNTG